MQQNITTVSYLIQTFKQTPIHLKRLIILSLTFSIVMVAQAQNLNPTVQDYQINRLLFFQKAILVNISDEKLEELLPEDVSDMNIHPIGTAIKLLGIEWREKTPLDYKNLFELQSLGYVKLGTTENNLRLGNLLYPAKVHTYINCSNYFHLEITEVKNIILIVLKNEKGHVIFQQRCP